MKAIALLTGYTIGALYGFAVQDLRAIRRRNIRAGVVYQLQDRIAELQFQLIDLETRNELLRDMLSNALPLIFQEGGSL